MTESANTVYPLSAARRVILHAQGLSAPNARDQRPTPDDIYETVARVVALQVDTLQVVARSHNLALWSRLGSYDGADFDRLIYGEDRRLFEDWLHAACILPLAEYRYILPHKRRVREQRSDYFRSWVAEAGNAELLDSVVQRIREKGPVTVGDFEYNGPKRGSWWDWKPAKTALEYRYAWGDLMIADRVNFARVYDLTERVLPDWVERTEPSRAETVRHTVELGVRSFGLCRAENASNLAHDVNLTEAKPYVAALIAEGVLVPVKVALADGRERELVIHSENLSHVQRAADGDLPAQRTTFLSPFDSLFWPLRRDRDIWGFHQTLEAYVPAPKRRWGYFCLPILHGERLVGRFDPKVERATGTLRLKSLYLESGVAPEEELVAGVAVAMRDFMAFHQARDLIVERSEPAEFGRKLAAVM